MREIVLDTETTGLNYKSGDRVIEVGCVELINHIPSGKTLQFYCFSEKEIAEEVFKITGLTKKFLDGFKPFSFNAKNFIDFVKKDTLVIHNAEFDLGFLNNELKICGFESLKNHVIDTVSLARKKLNTRIANLDYLCKRFSIDLSKRKLHGALLDSHLLAEVYLELLGGRQSSLKLKNLKGEEKTIKKTPANSPNKITKIVTNDDDIQKHKNFVADLKNSLWHKVDY